MNILIINSFPEDSDKLYNYLKVHGYNIIIIDSLDNAMELLSSSSIDMVIFENLGKNMQGYHKLPLFEQQLVERKIKTVSMHTELRAG